MPPPLRIAIGLPDLVCALEEGLPDGRPETRHGEPRARVLGAVFAVAAAGAEPRLSGYRAQQPKWIATSRDGERQAWRIPLPVPGTPKRQRVDANGSVETIEWTENDFHPGTREGGASVHGVERSRQGQDRGEPGLSDGRAHIHVAERIHQVEEMRARGMNRHGWERIRKKFEQELPGNYEPRTEALRKHARVLPPVLARIVRNPKTVLAREERIVPSERVEHTSRRTMKWLAGRPGRTMEERAKRGVLTEVRITDHNTRENRAVRDFAQMTVREIRRSPSGSDADEFAPWKKECANVAAALRKEGVKELEPGAKSNQVLRMNPDYRRIWTAREDLIRKTDLEDELWGWQAEGWNELGLLVASVAVMTFKGWSPVVTPPMTLRLGQKKGRWLALRQEPFCVLVEPEGGWWIEVHAEGAASWEDHSRHEVPPGACCALTLGRTEDPSGKKAKLALCILGTQEGEILRLDRLEALADGEEREAVPYDIGVLTAQERMPEVNPHRMSTGAGGHEGRVFAVAMRPESGLGKVMDEIQRAIVDLRRRAEQR